MYTEVTLREFPLSHLYTLLSLKLREVEGMEQKGGDIKQRILKREELERIQKVIDEKRLNLS